MVKTNKANPDYILMGITGLLIVFGIIILASTATSIPPDKFGSNYYFLNHQIIFGLIPGLLLGLFLLKLRLSLLKKIAPVLLIVNIILMMLVFVPKIGMKSGGTARWISLGFLSFQPSEFLKITFILYLASWLESRKKHAYLSEREKEFKESLIAFSIIIGLITALLALQSDISTLIVIVSTGILMYFFAETPIWHIVLIGIMGIVILLFLIQQAPYRMQRILVFLNPEKDPMGLGYQIKQSLIAVGSGGLFGIGLGMSQQKFGLLPHPASDSVFAILAEETGFVGSTVLIFLFLLFLWEGYKIGRESHSLFSKLTALGITSWIILQAFINIGAMIGILPLTGIPLPFISYGGSALLAELAGIGILLNISKHI